MSEANYEIIRLKTIERFEKLRKVNLILNELTECSLSQGCLNSIADAKRILHGLADENQKSLESLEEFMKKWGVL